MKYKQHEVNLHTHTFYCGHAQGTCEEIVQQTIKENKLKVLGISEHAPLKDQDGGKNRMNYCDLQSYTNDVKKVKEETKGLKILLGAECEWLQDQVSFYKEELLDQLGYDYLIMGIHFVYDDMGRHYIGKFEGMRRFLSQYVKDYTKGLESGLFLFGCHPDLFAPGFPVWDADAKAASWDIIQCAKDLDIPLELNDYGFRKKPINGRRPYSVDEFWELAALSGIKICTNSDSHDLNTIYPSHTLEYAKAKGINFVDWDFT